MKLETSYTLLSFDQGAKKPQNLSRASEFDKEKSSTFLYSFKLEKSNSIWKPFCLDHKTTFCICNL